MAEERQLICDADHTVYAGQVPDTDWHLHASVTLIVSRGSEFHIELEPEGRIACHSVLLEAGLRHRLLSNTQPLWVCFLEQHSPVTQRIRQHCLSSAPLLHNPVSRALPRPALESLVLQGQWQALLGLQRLSGCTSMDERVLACAVSLSRRPLAAAELSWLARECCLSESRLRHLFRDHLGVSLQYYRQWAQMRGLMLQLRDTHSLTRQALAHGFFDSAHFSRSCRKLIGVTPSSITRGLQVHTGRKQEE